MPARAAAGSARSRTSSPAAAPRPGRPAPWRASAASAARPPEPRQRGRRGEQVGDAAERALQRLAVGGDEPAGDRARGDRRDLLADHRSDGELGRVGMARQPQPRVGPDERAEQLVAAERRFDPPRVGVEVEQRPRRRLGLGRGRRPERARTGRAPPRRRAAARPSRGRRRAAGCGDRRRPPAPRSRARRGGRGNRSGRRGRTAGAVEARRSQ